MIDKNSFMPLNFFKKTDYYGSLSGLRYRIGKTAVPYTDEERAEREKKGEPVGEEEQKTVLRAIVWEGPFSYGKHDAGTEYHKDFPFAEDGIGMAVDWINGEYERDADRWQRVPFWTPGSRG
ncbi:MAG: hypothetical protein K2N41_00675 [Lachnospiraceae bacterium]|nr:hypothetical protein [Lachnospiraceae bacterium]MDE7238210.1 hypothetical protein [Lachnospiraceae bacterium]